MSKAGEQGIKSKLFLPGLSVPRKNLFTAHVNIILVYVGHQYGHRYEDDEKDPKTI